MSIITVADLQRELSQWEGTRVVHVVIKTLDGARAGGFSESVKLQIVGKNARQTSDGDRNLASLTFTCDEADLIDPD